jgi:lipid-binding SYLF domain-containing protein
MKLKRLIKIGISCLSAALLSGGILYAGEGATKRLKVSAEVLTEIMATPDKGIPQELLENSECIVIVEGMKKAAFIVGGNYGRGFMLCRQASGSG